MRHLWNENPFLRLLLPLIFGIIMYDVNTGMLLMPLILSFIVLLLSVFFFKFLNDYQQVKFAFIKGIFLQGLMFIAGYMLCIVHSISSSPSWYHHQSKDYPFALIRIQDLPQEKPKTIKMNVKIECLVSDKHSIRTGGEAFIYLRKSKKSLLLKQGDYVLVRNDLKDIKSQGNPGEFDYAKYCRNKNIYQSAFLNDQDWQKTTYSESSLNILFSTLGFSSRSVLKKYINHSVSLGIAEALLMGYRDDIDDEVWKAYANTGIVHIIAISGMHMAMIYMSVRWLLLSVPLMRRYRMLSLGFAIMLMWVFAGIAGLPPSVLRAAIMFSFIGIGEMFERQIKGLNNLSASAFFLLCMNPFWLQDIGFQLSYLAVLSLLIFYQPIYQWIYIPSKALDAIWKLLAATIAAQILTFPFCIYYFHQFPLLFLLTNLIAVPATTFILYTEILLISFSWLKPLATILGSIVSNAISWLNQAVFFVNKLSFAVWGGLQIHIFETILLFSLISFLSLWLITKNKRYFPFALASILMIISSLTIEKLHCHVQKKFIIYNLRHQGSIEFINGSCYFIPLEDTLRSNTHLYDAVIAKAHLNLGVKEADTNFIQMEQSQSLDLFKYEKVLIAKVKRNNFQTQKKIHVDYLIISDKCQPDLHWLTSNFEVKQYIIDSSLPAWKLKKWKSILQTQTKPVHDVQEDGAFIAHI